MYSRTSRHNATSPTWLLQLLLRSTELRAVSKQATTQARAQRRAADILIAESHRLLRRNGQPTMSPEPSSVASSLHLRLLEPYDAD